METRTPTTGPDDATYTALQSRLCRGWNTWDVRSMLSQVLLPQGLCVRLGIKEYAFGRFLNEALVGRHGDNVEVVRPAARSYDGAYTDLEITWSNIRLRVESAADDDGLVWLVTPLDREAADRSLRGPVLVVRGAFLFDTAARRRRAKGLGGGGPGMVIGGSPWSAGRISRRAQGSLPKSQPAAGPGFATAIVARVTPARGGPRTAVRAPRAGRPCRRRCGAGFMPLAHDHGGTPGEENGQCSLQGQMQAGDL